MHLIKRSLVMFQLSWNNHKIRTENHFTPIHLFKAGLGVMNRFQRWPNGFTELDQDQRNVMLYKVNQSQAGTRPLPKAVEVEEIKAPLFEEETNELMGRFDPGKVELSNLIQYYLTVKSFVLSKVEHEICRLKIIHGLYFPNKLT